jgi:hypothetical protein
MATEGRPELIDVHDLPGNAVGTAISRYASIRGDLQRGVVETGQREALIPARARPSSPPMPAGATATGHTGAAGRSDRTKNDPQSHQRRGRIVGGLVVRARLDRRRYATLTCSLFVAGQRAIDASEVGACRRRRGTSAHRLSSGAEADALDRRLSWWRCRTRACWRGVVAPRVGGARSWVSVRRGRGVEQRHSSRTKFIEHTIALDGILRAARAFWTIGVQRASPRHANAR